ncbi:MAG: ABC transporter ATP-binding protein [Verrucomicrobiota bacterium]|nr:ABC transporter ATP-binding protein [Verrucomicrobiota bacterium]
MSVSAESAGPDSPTPGPVVLRAQGVVKRYRMGARTLEVLRGIDLAVRQGTFLALRGASGAGKSTLLHLLGGLDVPEEGEIWFQGRNLATLSQTELSQIRNRYIGFVFQAYHLLPELDALENVCLPARIARIDPATATRRGRELLARVGLADRMDHKPAELSGGEQQRVAIARALINQPELILADEPTGNLDSRTGEEILQLLLQIRSERSVTLVMATHDERVAAHAPVIVDLMDGQIRAPNRGPASVPSEPAS